MKIYNYFKKNFFLEGYNLGILMMIISSLLLSFIAIMIKYLKHFPLMEITLFRNLPTIVILSLILKNNHISMLGNNKKLLFVRSFFGITSQISYFYTCTMLVLSDAMAIRQLSPIFIFIFSMILLKEKYKYKQFLVFFASFIGALFIIRPGIRVNITPAFIGLMSSVLLAGSYVTVRELRKSEHPLVIVNHLSWSIFIFSSISLIITKAFVLPNLYYFWQFILLGLLGLGSQFTLTKAYQLVPAGIVSLYMYSQIIFSCILDYFFFSDIPDLYSIFGAFLIMLSGYLNYYLRSRLH